MKKHSSLFLGLFLFVTSAFAETPTGLGLHTGINFANRSSDSTTPTHSFAGFIFGATYDHPLNENLSVVPGAQFIQRGYGVDDVLVDSVLRDINIKITYLEFPLMFQARFTGAGVTPFFAAGPVLGLKLGTSCTLTGATCETGADTLNSTHVGLEIGGGVIFPIENAGSIIAQIRYHLGLSKIVDDADNVKNRGLLTQVGYLF